MWWTGLIRNWQICKHFLVLSKSRIWLEDCESGKIFINFLDLLVSSCTFGGLSLVLFSGLAEAVAPFSWPLNIESFAVVDNCSMTS